MRCDACLRSSNAASNPLCAMKVKLVTAGTQIFKPGSANTAVGNNRLDSSGLLSTSGKDAESTTDTSDFSA